MVEPDAQPDAPDDSPAEPGRGPDLLSIGLLVFFIVLIATVGALLFLPALPALFG